MTAAAIGQLTTGTTGLLLLGLAGYALGQVRYRVPGIPYLVALAVAAAVWCFGYALEKSQTTVEGFMVAARIGYLGLAFVPWLWFLVAMHWMEHPWARYRVLNLVAFALGAVLCLAVWTNELHHLWYASVVPTGRVGFARFVPGPLYYPLYGILASSFVLSAVLLVVHRRRVTGFRRKAAVILTASAFPLVFSLAFQAGFRPAGLDPTIFSLIPSFLAIGWGLFRHDFIRLVPVARDSVFESMAEAVLVVDPSGRLIDANRAAEPLLPALGPRLEHIASPRGEVFVELAEGHRVYRFRRSRLDGPGVGGRGEVILLTDVTEERRLLDELAHQARHDPLTGVANRRHFVDHAVGELTRAARHGGTLALILFDLDHFKAINDRFGHPGGDQVLKAVIATIAPRLRPYDVLARIGGEEFTVLMPEVQAPEAREAAERWRAALEATPIAVAGGPITVTASFGVATLDDLPLSAPADPATRLDALLGAADRALYRAKAEGRNRVC